MKKDSLEWLERLGAACTAGLLGASAIGYPKSFWEWLSQNAPWYQVVLPILSGILALQPVSLMLQKRYDNARDAARKKVLLSYAKLLKIAQKSNLEFTDPALHVWLVRFGRMKRVWTLRLSESYILRLDFSPKKGEGVTGICWKTRDAYSADISALKGLFFGRASYDEQTDLNPEKFMNLSYEKFLEYQHRGAVFAAPVISSRGKVLGVVSFDTSAGYCDLMSHNVLDELTELANSLSPGVERIE